MFKHILGNKSNNASSSDTAQQTESSELSYYDENSHYDSHICQSVKITTAEIDVILEGGLIPDKNNISFNMDGENGENSDLVANFTSTPISNNNRGTDKDDITQTIGAAPKLLSAIRKLGFDRNSSAFVPPAVVSLERPVVNVNRVNPSLLTPHLEEQTHLRAGIRSRHERAEEVSDDIRSSQETAEEVSGERQGGGRYRPVESYERTAGVGLQGWGRIQTYEGEQRTTTQHLGSKAGHSGTSSKENNFGDGQAGAQPHWWGKMDAWRSQSNTSQAEGPSQKFREKWSGSILGEKSITTPGRRVEAPKRYLGEVLSDPGEHDDQTTNTHGHNEWGSLGNVHKKTISDQREEAVEEVGHSIKNLEQAVDKMENIRAQLGDRKVIGGFTKEKYKKHGPNTWGEWEQYFKDRIERLPTKIDNMDIRFGLPGRTFNFLNDKKKNPEFYEMWVGLLKFLKIEDKFQYKNE